MKNVKFIQFIPLLIGLLLGFGLGWWGFRVLFPWIGGWITIGILIAANREGKAKDFGRKISILMISPIFLIFLGLMQRENLQYQNTKKKKLIIRRKSCNFAAKFAVHDVYTRKN